MAPATPGCGLKAFRRELFLGAALFRTGCTGSCPPLAGAKATASAMWTWSTGPRRAGVSNYGMWDRLWVGILDLMGVWWLIRRKRRVPK